MKRIVITGATGWIGRAMIHALIDQFGLDILRVLELYGSKKQTLDLKSGISLEINPISSIDLQKKIDLLVPLAFLTQEKYNSLGSEEYQRINRQIIDSHATIIRTTLPNAVIYFSSGITTVDKEKFKRTDSFFVYKDLKIQEEELFRSLVNSYEGSLSVCKLFSVSGFYMRDPHKYALGDFILQASAKKSIRIESSSEVYRRYIQDTDLCALMLRLGLEKKNVTVESSGRLIELGDLAKTVAQIFGLEESAISRAEITGEPDNYFSNDEAMDKLLIQYRLKPASLEEQVAATIPGVMLSLNRPN
jgi:nucleoside-diphosphate-sugar epimerase